MANTEFKKITLPVLITKGGICFPNQEFTLFAERSFSIDAIRESIEYFDSLIFIVAQKDFVKNDNLNFDDIYKVGTLCKILFKNEANKVLKVTVQGIERYKFNDLYKDEGCYHISGEIYSDIEDDPNVEVTYINNIVKYFDGNDIEEFFGKQPKTFYSSIKRGLNSKELSYLFSQAIQLEPDKKQELLEAPSVNERLKLLVSDLEILKIRSKVDRDLQQTIRKTSEKAQKEYYLREQLKAIRQELGETPTSNEDSYEEKLNNGNYPKEVKDKVREEIKRMKNLPSGTLEYSLILDYLDQLFALPYENPTKDNDDLNNAQKILDEDHYGLEKVKERIIEYLAVKKVNGNLKAPVICFYGPPGTGKTSLSMSIARALGRKFVKCSLGGISDEAEIRGHRRTYVGSKPGRIMTFMKKAGTVNPVFCLDEVDKISVNGFKGDPAAALLEVLDPEQNTHFRDNYLEIEYDLSNVLFICTCNYLDQVPEALRDRLELIPIDSYTLLEKAEIATHHLIKKECQNNGLDYKNVKFTKDAIIYIIERYTREAGVRDLSRKIGKILRKVIVDQLKNNTFNEKIKITITGVKKYLGVELFDPTDREKKSQVGIVTGLAYTQFGGDILPIEVNHFEGKGSLVLTGNLGDIMKESCSIALDYVKANAKKYGIDPEFFSKNDIHIHVPEGAVPKDGPSAGIAITTAIISALTNKPVSSEIAMTGEVNLRGNALPIGGLREKSLAALRSGIKTIIVPKGNHKNVSELPKEITSNLNVVYMDNVDDAIKVCM